MCFLYEMMLIVDGRVYFYAFSWQLSVRALKLLESLQFSENQRSWEHCCISWGGTKSPMSKACESSLAASPFPSLHPRHIQTLSKSCQVNLLNISGICTLLSVLAASSLGQALFICLVLLQQQAPFWSSCHDSPLTHAIRLSYLKIKM
jgi:hypothetical protein